MQNYRNYHEIALRHELEIDVEKLDDLAVTSEILDYLEMLFERWLINVYYQV